MPARVPLDYEPASARRRPRPVLRLLLLCFLTLLGLLLIAAILVPSGGSHPLPGMRCLYNLRAIGSAVAAYCDANQQQYPSDMGLLITAQGLGAATFVCADSGDTVLQAPPTQQAATLLSGGHCAYVYVGAGLTGKADSRQVVAFELPGHHGNNFCYVLRVDGISVVPFEELVQLIPELEAGRNPPVIRSLTAAQAKTIYDQEWAPRLPSIKGGTWAGSLPRPSTRPSARPN